MKHLLCAQLWAQVEKDEQRQGLAAAPCQKSATNSVIPEEGRGEKGASPDSYGRLITRCWEEIKTMALTTEERLEGVRSDQTMENFKRQALDLTWHLEPVGATQHFESIFLVDSCAYGTQWFPIPDLKTGCICHLKSFVKI